MSGLWYNEVKETSLGIQHRAKCLETFFLAHCNILQAPSYRKLRAKFPPSRRKLAARPLLCDGNGYIPPVMP